MARGNRDERDARLKLLRWLLMGLAIDSRNMRSVPYDAISNHETGGLAHLLDVFVGLEDGPALLALVSRVMSHQLPDDIGARISPFCRMEGRDIDRLASVASTVLAAVQSVEPRLDPRDSTSVLAAIESSQQKLPWADVTRDVRRFFLRVGGEGDAFTHFAYRSRNHDDGSWATLARMQHFKGSTRLLDWTQSLHVAVFFAIQPFFESLRSSWLRVTRRGEPGADKDAIMRAFPSSMASATDDTGRSVPFDPRVWIMNPYSLSVESTGKLRIWDLSKDPALDYFHAFLAEKSWPHTHPIPVFCPWSDERMRVQQAFFTVHGHDRRPIDQQFPPSSCIYDSVPVSWDVAVFASLLLMQYHPSDRSNLMMDFDTIGHTTAEDFLGA